MTGPMQWLFGAVAIALLIAIPVITGGTYYAYLGIIVFIYGIVAIGLNILSGYAGQFSLGHAAFMAMGAYTTAILSKSLNTIPFFAQTGLHIWLGVIIGTVFAALFGIVLAIPALRVRGPYLAMVTVAFGWVVWKILQEWVTVTGGDLGISSIPKPRIGVALLDTRSFYYVVLFFFLAALALQLPVLLHQVALATAALGLTQRGGVPFEALRGAFEPRRRIGQVFLAPGELAFQLGLRCLGRGCVTQHPVEVDVAHCDCTLNDGVGFLGTGDRHRRLVPTFLSEKFDTS